MDAFLKAASAIKLPTILILSIVFYAGVELLLNSNNNIISLNGIAGGIILVVGVIQGMIAFLDYRYRESAECQLTFETEHHKVTVYGKTYGFGRATCD